MSEPNEAHIQTEERLKKLEERIAEVYREAYEAKSKSVEAYFAELERADKKNKALLEQGKISAKKYKQWRQEAYFKGELYKKMRDELAERMTHANEIAIAYVNDETPSIYSINRNWSSYKIESQVGSCNFTLFNEQAVKRLIVENPSLMPNYPAEKAVKRGIDLAWGKKQITASITSGILQGESVPEIAKNLQSRITDMNYKSAVRAARTSVIGAENAGTLDSLIAAAKMGINVKKLWISTLDGRTRHSHAVLDGETAELTKAFSNGLMYPGDPNGRPEEVYNCRCTIAGDIPDEPDEPNTERRARSTATGKNYIIKNMTYQEWEKSKQNQGENQKKNIGNSSKSSVELTLVDIPQTTTESTATKNYTVVKDMTYQKDEKSKQVNNAWENNLQPRGQLPHIAEDDLYSFVAEELNISENKAIEYTDAVMAFTDASGVYYDVRKYQRGEKLDKWVNADDIEKISKDAEEYIKMGPRWNGGETFRGVSISDKTLRSYTDGGIIDMGGMASWSSKKSVSIEFATKNTTYATPNAVIFHSATQNKGTAIRHMSVLEIEDEVLCSKDAKYKIIKKENDDSDIIHVFLEET